MPAAAEKLHLDLKVVEALEADRFAELGASVYVRGHLRRYADFVGESGVELVNLYSAREARPPPPDLTQFPQAERRSDPRRLVTPLVGLGCAVVLAAAIWWVLGTPGPAPSNQASAVPAVAGVPASAAASPKAQLTAAPAASSVTAPAPLAVTATEPSTAERREDTAPVRPTQLTLQLSSESWVEVYDSRGERLFFDIAGAGSVQNIEGRPPLRVVLGNAAAVAVQVNGQSREIPAAAVAGDGARFIVNRSGSLSRSRQ
jgi:cytoskeleton protein RodZ